MAPARPRPLGVFVVLVLTMDLIVGLDAGRMFDVTSLNTENVVTEVGSNLTLGCPGVTEHSLVLVLEWFCSGCSSFPGAPHTLASSSHHADVKLVEYRGESTTVWQNRERVTLNSETYALNFHPVVAGDTGQYHCLANNRPLPESIIKLVVQGPPDPPGRPLVLSFTSRAVNLSWAPPLDTHNSWISHYLIHLREGEDGDWESMTAINTENNQTSYQVTDLLPFGVYSFRIVGVNALGQSPPSKESYYIVTLREVPDGKPTITAAQNASSTSIRLAWRPPPRNTIHGEFLGYRLAYRPRDKGPAAISEIYIRDPSIESYTIQKLQTFTQYLVSLQVFNPEGLGPPTTVAVITDEGVPNKPFNVTQLWVTDSMMELTWVEPTKPNGKLEGYRIYFMQNNFTHVETVKYANPRMKFALTNLEPFTEYKIWVKAFTWKNEGESSETIVFKTDVGGPNPPRIVNVSCQSEDSLFIEWQRPTKSYNSIDFYYVDYRSEEMKNFEEITLSVASQDELKHSKTLTNLTTNLMYEIRVRGGTRSVLETEKVYKGEYSDSRKILMQPNCEKVRAYNLPQAYNEFTPTMLAISIGASFALLLILISVVVWRRCFNGAYYYLDDPPKIPNNSGGGWEGDSAEDLKLSIPAQFFPKHVTELHVDSDVGFSKEYESIQASSGQDEFSSEHSQHPDNRQKNRYLNIVAYDHSRVRLLPMPGQKKTMDYLNANYIDGFKSKEAYIGTQGPLPGTFESFWRMVWEQNVVVIVMITNLVERGRKKCDQYWPKEVESYGVIQVRYIKEETMATYTVRTFQIRHLKQMKKKKGVGNIERTVYHYHYTNWPDHGTPSHPLPVLSFIKKSSAANGPESGPIIVHCSAGVGRTGTYIVLDTMLKQIKARGDINVFGFLNHIRTQRNFLVQTEEQYIFIHDSLVEAIESGETNINRSYFSRYIHSLLSGSYADEKSEITSLLERQFKLATNFTPKDFHLTAALKPCNLTKNRNLDCVCTDAYRVLLTPRPGIEGSDYINASFIPGYHKLQEFIITQHPQEATTNSFWQLLWDHNVQLVVLLSAIDNQEYPIFWPSQGEDLDYETFRVKFIQESERVEGYEFREFSIQSLQDDYELGVKMIHSAHWPHYSQAGDSTFDLVNMVQEITKDAQNGPIVVLDRFGGSEAATFTTLTTLQKQLKLENHIDVYLYSKLFHEHRPGIWKSLEDYLFLYRSMETLSGTMNINCNAESPLIPPETNFIGQTTIHPIGNGHVNGVKMNGGNGTIPRLPADGNHTEIDGNHLNDAMV